MAVDTFETSHHAAARPGLAPAGALLALGCAALVVLAAGAADAARAPHPALPPAPAQEACPDPTTTTAAEQRECGEAIYRETCWECHEEEDGSGTILDPDLLASYNNAWAVYDYISFSMPEDDPGILPEADYWAVTAYLLDSRELLGEDDVLTSETAEEITLGN